MVLEEQVARWPCEDAAGKDTGQVLGRDGWTLVQDPSAASTAFPYRSPALPPSGWPGWSLARLLSASDQDRAAMASPGGHLEATPGRGGDHGTQADGSQSMHL